MGQATSDPPGSTPGYRALVRLPGVGGPFVFATIGRFSFGPLALAILLAIESATGSYGDAGVGLAAFGFGTLNAPAKAWILDRYGTRRALPVIAVTYAVSIGFLAGACANGAAPTTLVAAAALAGFCSPPLGPVMRALWSQVTDGLMRRRAFSLDSALEQTIFALGPAVGAGVIAVTSAPFLLAGLGVLALVGSLGLAARAPSPVPDRSERDGPVDAVGSTDRPSTRLASTRFLAVLGSILGVGMALGILDVATAARAGEQGASAAAGLLFTALAAGSVAGGLLWGRLRPAGRHSTELTLLTIALAAMTAVLALVGHLVAVAAILLVGGLAVAPVFVVANTTADDLAPRARKTEALTWVNTSNNLGTVAGSAIAGVLLDSRSLESTFVVATAVLLVTTVAVRAVSHGRRDPDHGYRNLAM